MKRILLLWAFNTVALIVADWLVDGIHFDDEWVVIPAGAVFGVVNWLVKPIVTLLSLPVIILTLGIALFFVNLLMLYLTSWIVSGLQHRRLLVGRRGDHPDLAGEQHPPGRLRRRRHAPQAGRRGPLNVQEEFRGPGTHSTSVGPRSPLRSRAPGSFRGD